MFLTGWRRIQRRIKLTEGQRRFLSQALDVGPWQCTRGSNYLLSFFFFTVNGSWSGGKVLLKQSMCLHNRNKIIQRLGGCCGLVFLFGRILSRIGKEVLHRNNPIQFLWFFFYCFFVVVFFGFFFFVIRKADFKHDLGISVECLNEALSLKHLSSLPTQLFLIYISHIFSYYHVRKQFLGHRLRHTIMSGSNFLDTNKLCHTTTWRSHWFCCVFSGAGDARLGGGLGTEDVIQIAAPPAGASMRLHTQTQMPGAPPAPQDKKKGSSAEKTPKALVY